MAATLQWTGGRDQDWGVAANWVNVATGAASVPVNGDTVVFIDNSVPVSAGLDQSAVTLAALQIDQSYTGTIGTVSDYLHIGATSLRIGEYRGLGSATGSTMLKINTGTVESAIYIANGKTATSGRPPIQLLVNKDTTTVEVLNGYVGIASEAGETASIANLVVGSRSSGSARVVAGSGTTVAVGGGDVNVLSGTLVLLGDCNNIYVRGGECVIDTADAINAVTVTGGTCYLDRHGTITLCNCRGGISDWSRTSVARTVTGLDVTPNLGQTPVVRIPASVTQTPATPTYSVQIVATAL